jgi:hypothetical protein
MGGSTKIGLIGLPTANIFLSGAKTSLMLRPIYRESELKRLNPRRRPVGECRWRGVDVRP